MSTIYQRNPPQAVMPSIFDYVYFVPKWGDHQRGFKFDLSPNGYMRIGEYQHGTELLGPHQLAVPIDMLTAVSLGLVTPEEINMPEGLRAAFNLLK